MRNIKLVFLAVSAFFISGVFTSCDKKVAEKVETTEILEARILSPEEKVARDLAERIKNELMKLYGYDRIEIKKCSVYFDFENEDPQIEKIEVAVNILPRTVIQLEGKRMKKGGTFYTPLSDDELIQVEKLVKAAIGYSQERGDEVEITCFNER